jgi:hypothetical protein
MKLYQLPIATDIQKRCLLKLYTPNISDFIIVSWIANFCTVTNSQCIDTKKNTAYYKDEREKLEGNSK